jgi:hypothetical protein
MWVMASYYMRIFKYNLSVIYLFIYFIYLYICSLFNDNVFSVTQDNIASKEGWWVNDEL